MFEYQHWICWLLRHEGHIVPEVLLNFLYVHECYQSCSGCHLPRQPENPQIANGKITQEKSTLELPLFEIRTIEKREGRLRKSMCHFTSLYRE